MPIPILLTAAVVMVGSSLLNIDRRDSSQRSKSDELLTWISVGSMLGFAIAYVANFRGLKDWVDTRFNFK